MKFGIKELFFFACLILFSAKSFRLYSMEKNYPEDHDYFLGDPINENNTIEKNSRLKIKCRKKLPKVSSFICGPGFKLFVVCFLILETVGMYFLIDQLLSGCETMKDRCDVCANELAQCENAYELVKNVTTFLLNLWNNCPAGREDVMNDLQQIKDVCCNGPEFELKNYEH